ncbi:MAG: DUF3431 domain-containing protein [Ardenticatenaceae bacterium]|nr:DUF3431 domain-containing protein [Ardenticatenaceae bacterium]
MVRSRVPGLRRRRLARTAEIVIARYREDVSWARRLPYRVTIYDKGGDWRGGIRLPNVGRESHTYLYHIVTRYERLADATVFLQGDPFPHRPDLREALETLIGTPERLATFCSRTHYAELSAFRITFDGRGGPHHPWLPLAEMYADLFGEVCPPLLVCRANGLFAASRSRIHQRPRTFYVRCCEMLSHDRDPLEGYVFERLWHVIFGET